MDAAILLRALVLLVSYLTCAAVIWSCRRSFPAGIRLAFDFCMALYLVTFHAGSSWLFVFQDAAIHAYFGGALAPADNVPYGGLLMLSTLPLLVVPVAAWTVHRLVGRLPRKVNAEPPREAALWLGVALALAIVLAFTGELIPNLVGASLTQFGSTSTLGELYARRRESFEALNSIQAGLIYSTLPACSALLLFHGTSHSVAARLAGAALAVVAVLANIGLFQVGPLLAFGLMCALCMIVRYRERIRLRHAVVVTAAVMSLLGSYLAMKGSERDDNVSVPLQVMLRMPVALPYLFQMAREDPQAVAASSALPFDLGEFMFPELRTRERFVAMPQPSHVNAWFQSGALALMATLFVVGGCVALGGRWLHRSMRAGAKSMSASIALAPLLYYVFQVTLTEVLLSSYGMLYVSLPLIATWAAGRLSRHGRVRESASSVRT